MFLSVIQEKQNKKTKRKRKNKQNYLLAMKRKIILLAQVGLGVAKPAPLLVSQDFFAELRLLIVAPLDAVFLHPMC